MRLYINVVIAFLCANVIWAQQIQKSEYGTFLLSGGTVHTVTNGNIEADVLISDGKITSIGTNITAPSGAKVIDVAGKHIYPGMIDGGTRLGIVEIGAVSLTNDDNEVGDINPHVEALTAVNPSSVLIPVTRVSGVTTVLTKPTGGVLPGTSSLISLVGYTPEQMYSGFDGLIMNFPSSGRRGWWDRRSDEDIKKDFDKRMKTVNDIWKKAEAYARMNAEQSVADYNPEMEAMKPVVEGKRTLMMEVNSKKDILAALEWLKEKKDLKVVLTGVAEGYRVVDELKEAGYPVITGPILSVPGRAEAAYDASYTNPGMMQKAGIKVAIRTNETENVRNLPFNAGFAAAYGMGIEEALKAVTIVPAEIFGVADQYGSIEEGKMASLFVSDGDPFETKTQITDLFINGWKVPIESRHTLLYDEFLDRSPGLEKE
ncbi:amidohydrolase family protein [Portibacter marinus]|uniref:amidohydrolase family protein n=1 Tax=Portibacter marinus TaxID=2898660 RepID=UPI001F39EBE0|nr:amidohydrolase family protein [Portibacter marinus]